MKKLLVSLMAFTLSLSVVGCGTKTVKGPEGSLEEIVTAMYDVKTPEFAVGNPPFDIMEDSEMLKSFTGLSNSDAISEVYVSESMMGSQAYSVVLVRVNEVADAATVAQEMKDGIDTRKWICVEADDLKVVSANDVVMLVMMSSEYSEMMTSQDLVDAFSALSEGLDTEL